MTRYALRTKTEAVDLALRTRRAAVGKRVNTE
jgi:Arc/MetJ family transcription regulator